MSDKSFGDYTNKSIVKNPLLSSAVTGLSLEDLTHKAVLLPVTTSLGQITRSDQQQGSQTRTLAHSEHETPTFPSGDAFSNITLSNTPHVSSQNISDSKNNAKLEKNRDTLNVTQSKASVKANDDFDVNEYIARLQGSRYVSAPLHSHLKEDQNTNLEATEENLEEINLNESQNPVEVQQSLTADIAQNLSQLPTVLPHVASAVFTSFSNMLSYKIREQTPDRVNVKDNDQRENKGGYDEVQFQKPDVAVPLLETENYGVPKEVAPPPKELPIGGKSNFRITTKKKYAQIPGLSSGDAAQTMTFNAPVENMQIGQNIPPIGQNASPFPQHATYFAQNVVLTGQNVPGVNQTMPPFGQNMPPIGQNMPPIGQNMPPIGQNMPPVGQSVPTFFNPNDAKVDDLFKPTGRAVETEKSYESNLNTQNVAGSQSEINQTENENVISAIEKLLSESQPNESAVTNSSNVLTLIEPKEQAPPQNIPKNTVPGSASIIPPPPMFSNLPRMGSQSSIGKSILPPSVARRISANQPIIKPAVSTPSFSDNIFVPAVVSEVASNVLKQDDNNFPAEFPPSAFVPAYSSPIKPDSEGTQQTQIDVSSNISASAISQTPATYFIPSNEEKPRTSTEDTSFSSKEIGPVVITSKEVAIPTTCNPIASNIPASNVASIDLHPTSSIFTPGTVDIKMQSSIPPPIFQSQSQSWPLPPTIFDPIQQAKFSSEYAPHPITQMPSISKPEPPKPVVEPPKASGNVNFRMTKKRPQYYAGPIEGVGAISNNVKPIIAPFIPSATPAEVSNFQRSLFTPEQPMQPVAEQQTAHNIELTSVPFDISRPVENKSSQMPLDKSQEQAYVTPFNISQPENENYGQEYNTAFDLSRASTDLYSPSKQESKGFGIIGSLKSKLSSIDINKIQSTVTTFFDPAYNEAKITEPVAQDNSPYGQQQQFGKAPQGQSNFDIFVPNVEQNQYSQFKEVGYDYSPNNQYYQTLDPNAPNQGQNVYSTSSYFTNPNYSTEQVYTSNPLYDNTQVHLSAVSSNTQENILNKLETSTSKSRDISTFYNPNVFTEGSATRPFYQHQPIIDTSSQNKDQVKSDVAGTVFAEKNQLIVNEFNRDLTSNFDIRQQPSASSSYSQNNIDQQNMANTVVASQKAPENITNFSHNANLEESRQRFVNLQQSLNSPASFIQQSIDQHTENAASVSGSEMGQGPMFYNPNTFTIGNQQITNVFGADMQHNTYQINEDFAPNILKTTSVPKINSRPPCDSALNTSKYNMSSIKKPTSQQNVPSRVALLPAASFFDNPQTVNLSQFPVDNKTEIKPSAHVLTKNYFQPADLQQEQFETKNVEIYKMLTDTPIPVIGSKSKSDFKITDENIQHKDIEKEQLLQQNNLIESLSKDDIAVVGVSNVPLFGLSAMIADKSKEMSESENVPFLDVTQQTRKLFKENTGVRFFENIKKPENKIISASQIKETPLDITALSISDVKNVLVIEPPQENIGALLIRNASSSKLESLQKAEATLTENYRQQNDKIPSAVFQKKLNKKVDENETFFKHSDIQVKEKENKVLQKDASVEKQESEDVSELKIGETRREVDTPDILGHDPKHKEKEDLTTQMIDNITSRMQWLNPLTVPLTESDASINEKKACDGHQSEEITHVAEDTIETLHVQSATELLDDQTTTSDAKNYGWASEDGAYLAAAHIDNIYGNKMDSDINISTTHDYNLQIDGTSALTAGHGFEFKIDPNSVGFFGNNSLFSDNLPTNASDEIKAEIKHSHEDIVLPRQMSIPSAPPEEELKLDEPGVLDVHSIEQDAKKDFPLEEEFVIEPSTDDFLSTDDDKIELRERKRSSEDSISIDTFTNRIERFKKTIDNPNDDAFEQKGLQIYGSPPMSMASYFDTGNYAVESHYRNSLCSPTSINAYNFSGNVMRIPPGFEEEYARRLSGMSLSSGENKNEPRIPETSTQTRTVPTTTYSSAQDKNENVVGYEIRRKENIKAFAEAFTKSQSETNKPIDMPENKQTIDEPVVIADPPQTIPVFTEPTLAQPELFSQNVQPLQDPMKFFSSYVEETTPAPESAAPESFNRLASYFSIPQAQPEHSKSFFELSQSQNHYRHESSSQDGKHAQKSFFELSQSQNHYIDDDTKNNIKDLMKDLTSPQNIQERNIKIVNYFTVEHDNDVKNITNIAPINVKTYDETNINLKLNIDKKLDCKLVEKDCKDYNEIINCEYCINYIPGINTKDFKVRTVMNETPEANKEGNMTHTQENTERSATLYNAANHDVEGQAQGGVTVLNENRDFSEYTPVKHHWFYRLEVEDKSVWRGFSITDSQALEDAYQSPCLDETTLVATDGGRYDVNVMGRIRIAVYWKEKPTNVRRCSWFYKGTTDARYVPYTEPVAQKLEEEYYHGVTTGEWHRKLSLPNNEMVIMHGPTVMVHFLHSGATDAFSTPPSLLGKRVYRNPPKIRVPRDQEPTIDHLIFLVHGAGEYKREPFMDQTTTRPRVVRRSHEESEIEDSEPSRIDHLLLLCHGVGSACDMRFRSVEEVVEDFRATSLQLLQSHYRNSYDNGVVSRVEVLPISWHDQLHSGEDGVDHRLARVTLDSIPRLRAFTNHTVLDVLFYTSPVFQQSIMDTVCSELNRAYSVFKQRNPEFKGGVSLGGHSLGSVILYDLLCHQLPQSPVKLSKQSPSEKTYVSETAVVVQPIVNYPQLAFTPQALYALGSPIAIFECIRGVESLGMNFSLPTCKNFFNIFHPYDPIAYRIEPLINPQLRDVKPSQIPHHKGRKRMHLELRDTMVRVGTDLKQKLIESLRTTWNMWKATPPTVGQLEKVVEEEMEKEQLYEDDQVSELQATPEMLGKLNSGRRIDYVLQEAPLEMINEYLFAMSSHVGYWESEDTMLLMLREIYSSLGVQPDSTVPQQSMTVQRTRIIGSQEETSSYNDADYPSTSRGGPC